MTEWICRTCGVVQAVAAEPAAACGFKLGQPCVQGVVLYGGDNRGFSQR